MLGLLLHGMVLLSREHRRCNNVLQFFRRAIQYNPAIFDQTGVKIQAGRVEFRATGSVVKFDGFLAIYQEAKVEDPKEEEKEDKQ
jgi:DNA topoisomerase IA